MTTKPVPQPMETTADGDRSRRTHSYAVATPHVWYCWQSGTLRHYLVPLAPSFFVEMQTIHSASRTWSTGSLKWPVTCGNRHTYDCHGCRQFSTRTTAPFTYHQIENSKSYDEDVSWLGWEPRPATRSNQLVPQAFQGRHTTVWSPESGANDPDRFPH